MHTLEGGGTGCGRHCVAVRVEVALCCRGWGCEFSVVLRVPGVGVSSQWADQNGDFLRWLESLRNMWLESIIEYEASPGGGPHANAAGQSATGAPKPGPPRCTVPSRPAAPARTVSVDTLRDSGHSQRPHTDARTCVLCAGPQFPAPTAGVAYGPQDVYGYRCARPPPASWFSIHLAHRCIGIRTSMVHQHCADGSAA